MSASFRVFPMRFSSDPAAMVRFLEVLGLRSRLESANGGYATLDGASGSVAVHAVATAATEGVAPGATSLNVLVADVRAAAALLRHAGREADAWDEAYGIQGALRAPDGGALGLNESVQADLYGYRQGTAGEPGPIDVVAVWYTDDFVGSAAFFADLGFVPQGPLDDPWWCALRGPESAGVIGLHAPGGRTASAAVGDEPLDHPALVRLGFETAEPLEALASRLRAAGHPASALVDEAGPKLVVTDPDGQLVEVHPRQT